ncbi:MAG: 50S ribosomal protein L3 [Syntrophomonadaceae bacterium]|nr:50S ribosomal protein L3 [Bacillota bacterium]
MVQKAILGKKLGMTQFFDEAGNITPVTVIEAGPCVVVQKKTLSVDGYEAIQVGFGTVKEGKLARPRAGHFKKAGILPRKYLRELRLENIAPYSVGQELKADVFAPGEYVDVTAVSRGKGFAGAIKRHGHGRGPMSHGSGYHRGPGSMGSINAARIFKNQTMAGRMGGEKVTVQNLRVVKIDPERNLLLVCGAVPGARGALVRIKKSVKAAR